MRLNSENLFNFDEIVCDMCVPVLRPITHDVQFYEIGTYVIRCRNPTRVSIALTTGVRELKN